MSDELNKEIEFLRSQLSDSKERTQKWANKWYNVKNQIESWINDGDFDKVDEEIIDELCELFDIEQTRSFTATLTVEVEVVGTYAKGSTPEDTSDWNIMGIDLEGSNVVECEVSNYAVTNIDFWSEND